MNRTRFFYSILIIIIAINAYRHGSQLLTEGFSLYSMLILGVSVAAIGIVLSLTISEKTK